MLNEAKLEAWGSGIVVHIMQNAVSFTDMIIHQASKTMSSFKIN